MTHEAPEIPSRNAWNSICCTGQLFKVHRVALSRVRRVGAVLTFVRRKAEAAILMNSGVFE